MFNNAGDCIVGPAIRYSIENWIEIIDVNLQVVIYGNQVAYHLMVEQGVRTLRQYRLDGRSDSWCGKYWLYCHQTCPRRAFQVASYGSVPHGSQGSLLFPGVVQTPILDKVGVFGKNLIDIPPER